MKKSALRLVLAAGFASLFAFGAFAIVLAPPAEAMGGPGGQPCGGFAGLECPNERQVCIDDPRDNCDPKLGGADCIGICRGPGGGGTSQ